ncbi:MAG: DUF742 domain-containing protein [Pseudonocardia sp.]|jgi:hypothetical protein|nr:DUF742 domain-containing protein [Pseudonocardia sp.]
MTVPYGPDNRAGGRVVPVYALTRGRTRSAGKDMPIESLVTVTEHGLRSRASLDIEYRKIIELGQRPVSLFEIGIALGVPVGVARVLVSDLAASGHLVVHAPPPVEAGGGPSPELLGRLLDGLRAH